MVDGFFTKYKVESKNKLSNFTQPLASFEEPSPMVERILS